MVRRDKSLKKTEEGMNKWIKFDISFNGLEDIIIIIMSCW